MASGAKRQKRIAVHEWVIGPRLRKFANLAGCSENEALGVLCHIWIWGAQGNAASSGLLKDTSLEHIRNIFAGTLSKGVDPQRVVDALVESGWVDVRSGLYYINDWPEFQVCRDER